MFAKSVALTKSSMHTHAASPPTIVDYQRQVQCLEGEQVSLMVKADLPLLSLGSSMGGRWRMTTPLNLEKMDHWCLCL